MTMYDQDGKAGGTMKLELAEPSLREQIWKAGRVLIVAYLVLLFVSTMLEERLGGLVSSKTGMSPESKQMEVKPSSPEETIHFSDVVGVDEAKEELEEVVQFLKDPKRFTRLGGKMPKGVLLMGPPGTGKTMLARAIAGEAGVPFFYASGSEFEEMFVGVGARRVRDLFDAAKKKSPCIMFIDEIDAIGSKRNPRDQTYIRMTLNQLLAEMDGFKPTEGIIVIGATNCPEVLDKALTRPGRFDRHVVVPNPDVDGRRQILTLHSKNVPLAPDVDISVIARGTPGFSGADLANLVNIGALRASGQSKNQVSMHDLEYAKDKILMGAERKSAVITPKSRRLTAYHEGGHALVAALTPDATPLHKATIVPRGMALGMVMQLPEDDELNWTRKQMLAKLDVCMGGRVAEETIFGADEVTSGASSDLEQATNIARLMVEKFGMSSKVGYVAVGKDKEDVSVEMRRLVDQEVQSLTSEAYERATKLINAHRDELHLLANALLQHETLSGSEIKDAIKGQPIRGTPPTTAK
eukprot:CAMPEP_0175992106 /NCGR_PEP_ID=MMETSP0108-20121206/53210_1 /TAXON_ID=195067 ORGANISM="Goniomonas pacifica, Strain CCMP1869" /NCGR_SAMPLE_ID=MMETSP0108 /ASSEMBLY_ACC=CAM_ASM_000204 /LENGTH=523 /DNA_ID=CAMNT_0017323717 /DNA_START=9 /DNA_END=1580 /DNA_ORIENTATION=-